VLYALGLQGIGALFAWNAIITPISYYELQFAESPFRDSFESLLSVTFTATALAAVLALQVVQHRVSLRALIIASLAVQLGVFSVLALYTLIPVLQPADRLRDHIASNATASFAVTLACCAVMAATQATLTSSVISYSAAFPPKYTKSVSSGMAVAGLAVSIAGLATAGDHTAATSDADLRGTIVSAGIYFGVAVAVFAACLLSFGAIERTAFACAAKEQQAAGLCELSSDRQTTADAAAATGTCQPPWVCASSRAFTSCSLSATVRSTAHFAFAMVFCYTVTIGLFPAITGMISSSSESVEWQRFFPATLFILFNLGDLYGRSCPPAWLSSRRSVVLFSLFRALHAPLFMLCHMPPGKSALPALLDSDAAPMLLVLLLGLSNGMLTSSVLMRAPHVVPPAQASRAASLMILSLNVGLVLGSLTSFLLHWLLCHCNPFLA
jgi:equilibrative nucleoside transporter 1/2/3